MVLITTGNRESKTSQTKYQDVSPCTCVIKANSYVWHTVPIRDTPYSVRDGETFHANDKSHNLQAD